MTLNTCGQPNKATEQAVDKRAEKQGQLDGVGGDQC